MIATHNIKVNGRWYSAGEEIPERPVHTRTFPMKKEAAQEEKPVKAPEKEPEKAEDAPKKTTTSRRRVSK